MYKSKRIHAAKLLPWLAWISLVTYIVLLFTAFTSGLAVGLSTLKTYPDAAIATVTEVTQESWKSQDYYPCEVTFVFPVEGQGIYGTSGNVSETYCKFSIGDKVSITYDASDPTRKSAISVRYTHIPTGVILGLVGVAHTILAGGIWTFVHNRRMRHNLQSGLMQT